MSSTERDAQARQEVRNGSRALGQACGRVRARALQSKEVASHRCLVSHGVVASTTKGGSDRWLATGAPSVLQVPRARPFSGRLSLSHRVALEGVGLPRCAERRSAAFWQEALEFWPKQR